MWDPLHLSYFLLGIAGAVLTLYVAKQVVVPEFRPLVNIEPIEKDAQQCRDDIAKIQIALDKSQAMMTDQPLNSAYLTRVYNALGRSLRDEQTRLDRYERRLLVNQLVSRALGFFFFVLLGGVFAALFTGQVKVSLPVQNVAGPPVQNVASPPVQNIASLPDFFQAVVIGAGWTGLVSIFGIRGLQSTATNTIGQMGEQSKQWIDELKKSLVETIRPSQPVGAAPAAPPTPDELASRIAAQCDRAKTNISAHLDKAQDSIRRMV